MGTLGCQDDWILQCPCPVCRGIWSGLLVEWFHKVALKRIQSIRNSLSGLLNRFHFDCENNDFIQFASNIFLSMLANKRAMSALAKYCSQLGFVNLANDTISIWPPEPRVKIGKHLPTCTVSVNFYQFPAFPSLFSCPVFPLTFP